MAAYVYRGNDRNMLTKTVQVLNAIVARDKLVSKKTPSAKISNRFLMLDANPPGTGPLYLASQTLLTRFNALLAQTET